MVTMINDGKHDGKMMINYDKSMKNPLILKVTNCVDEKNYQRKGPVYRVQRNMVLMPWMGCVSRYVFLVWEWSVPKPMCIHHMKIYENLKVGDIWMEMALSNNMYPLVI